MFVIFVYVAVSPATAETLATATAPNAALDETFA